MANEKLVIKLQLIEIPAKNLEPKTFPLNQTNFPDITGSDDWDYQALSVKLSVAIVGEQDGAQLAPSWLDNAESLLFPWKWGKSDQSTLPVFIKGAELKWKAALRTGTAGSEDWETDSNKLKIATITTKPVELLQHSFLKDGSTENDTPELFLNDLRENTNHFLDKIKTSGSLNPSAQFSVFAPDQKSFIRYTDAPNQTVHEALEELGQQPAALSYHLRLMDYIVVAIKKEQNQPYSRPLIALIPEFQTTLPDGEIIPFLPKEKPEASLLDGKSNQKNAVWEYKIQTTGTQFPAFSALALAGRFKEPSPIIPPAAPTDPALAGLDHGQLMDLRTGNIGTSIAGQPNEPEVYTENWLPFLPSRLASSFNPLGALLDHIREQLPLVKNDTSKKQALFKFWQSAFPALLRDRAGTGIISRLDGSVPALSWRDNMIANNPGIEFRLDNILAKMAHYENRVLDKGALKWIQGPLKLSLDSIQETSLISELIKGFSGDVEKFSVYLELSEKLARIITEPEFLAILISHEWDAATQPGLINLSTGSTSFFQSLGHDTLKSDAVFKETGMLDFTKPGYSALSMKSDRVSLFNEFTTNDEFILKIHNKNKRSLSISIKCLDDTKAKIFWVLASGAQQSISFKDGVQPFNQYKNITRITYFLIRQDEKTGYTPLNFSISVENGDGIFETGLISLGIKLNSTEFLTDEMWCELETKTSRPAGSALVNSKLDVDIIRFNAPLPSNDFNVSNFLQLVNFSDHKNTILNYLQSISLLSSLEQSLIAPVYQQVITRLPINETESKNSQIILWRQEAALQFKHLMTGKTNRQVKGFQINISGLPANILIDFNTALIDRAKAGIHHAFPDRDGHKSNKFETRTHSISLRFDQFLEIEDDSWDDIQGIAYLVGFSPEEDADTLKPHWVSLNTARLSVANSSVTIDPLPLSVMETDQLRQAILTFDNRNLFAMPSEPKDVGNQSVDNTFHKFTQNSFPYGWKLPHLAYGTKLVLYGYLNFHGGILPEELRDRHPAKLINPDFPISTAPFPDKKRPGYIGEKAISKEYVHRIDYLRRVPVGAPRIDKRDGKQLLSYPDVIKPLAAELDSTTHRITLKPQTQIGQDSVPAEDRMFLKLATMNSGVIHLNSEEGIGFDLYQIKPNFQEITLEVIDPVSPNTSFFTVTIKKEDSPQSIETENNGLKIIIPDSIKVEFSLRINLYKAIPKKDINTTKIIASLCLSKSAHTYFDADGWEPHISSDGNIINSCETCETACIKLLTEWPFSPATPPNDLIHAPLKGGWLHIKNTGDRNVDMQIPHVREILPLHVQENSVEMGNITSSAGYGEKITLALDASPQAEITVLPMRGINTSIFKLRPPGLDFKSWAPAIVPMPKNNPTEWGLNHEDNNTSSYLNMAHRIVLSKKEKDQDKSFDDPYLDGIYIEATKIWKNDWKIGSTTTASFFIWDKSASGSIEEQFEEKYRYVGLPVTITNVPEEAFEILPAKNDNIKALIKNEPAGLKVQNVLPGDIVELRFFSATKEERYTSSGRDNQKFELSLARGQRRIKEGGTTYILSEPLKVRVENPTDRVIPTASLYELFNISLETAAPIEIQLRFQNDIINLNKNKRQTYAKLHHDMRYFQTFRLPPQRWYWFGRPLPNLGDRHLLSESLQDKLQPDELRNWEDIAYDGRDNSRVGIIPSAGLIRDHLPTITQKRGTFLHRETLDYTGQVQYWRYTIEVESRYSILTSKDLIVRAEIKATDESHDWKGLVIPGNIGVGANTKPIPRPSINLILPLTESLDANGQTGQSVIPPVLVIFDESFYEQGHIADRLDVMVAAIRHPLNAEPNLYQEAGPDPILSHKGLVPSIVKNAERLPALPVICEGIIGYTQSPLEESSDQRVAAAIISIDESPFVQNGIDTSLWRQSTMAKLQLRRYHDPFLNQTGLKEEKINTQNFKFSSDGIGKVFYIAIPISNDALSHDITLTNSHDDLDARTVNILLTKAKEASQICLATDGKIKINNSGSPENLFKAGDLILPFNKNEFPENIILRIILTGHGRDTSNNAASLTMTIALTTNQKIENAAKKGQDSWINATPINIDLVSPNITLNIPENKKVIHGAINLSPFTDPMWCQFSADNSRFRWNYTKDANDTKSYDLRVEHLGLEILISEEKGTKTFFIAPKTEFLGNLDDRVLDTFSSMISFTGNRNKNSLNHDKNVEKFVIYAAFTKIILDAGGRESEKFLGVARVIQTETNGLKSGQVDICRIFSPEIIKDTDGINTLGINPNERGRVRLITIQLSPRFKQKNIDAGEVFKTLFRSSETSGDLSISDDTTHIIYGVSRPINFSYPKDN